VIRPTAAAESSVSASPWRCTTFHSPSSRRKIVVARSTYDVGGWPAEKFQEWLADLLQRLCLP